MRELKPLPVPENRWDTISIYFIVELPKSHGYNAVMNVINLASKQAHFVSTNTTVTTLEEVQLYLAHVWKLHSLPKQMVSD